MWTDSRYRFRLYRDPANGVLAGVCAGIAEYFGLERLVVRLAFVVALVLFFPPTALAYIVLAIALPKRPPALYANREDEAFWRGVATAPDDTFHGLKRRFGDLENRLRAMEQSVTSSEFDLHRKFRDLR
jgi:phage shock protein C